VTASEEQIEAIREAQEMSNMSPADIKCKPGSTEEVISLLVDHELDVEEPQTKKGLNL